MELAPDAEARTVFELNIEVKAVKYSQCWTYKSTTKQIVKTQTGGKVHVDMVRWFLFLKQVSYNNGSSSVPWLRIERKIQKKCNKMSECATHTLVTLQHTSMKPGLILISEVNSIFCPKLKATQLSRDEQNKSIGILPQEHWPPSSDKMYQMYKN